MVWFFRRGDLPTLGTRWRDRARAAVAAWLLGDGPTGIMVAMQSHWWYMDGRLGCLQLPYVELPYEPWAKIAVRVSHPDFGPWQRRERLQVWRTLFDLLRLVPPWVRVVNCARVTADLLGVQERVRTPRQLAEVLQR